MPDSCLVCDARQFEPHLGILRRCRNCGFITAPVDEAIDPATLYGEAYFRGEEYLDYAADEAFIKRTLRPRLDALLAQRRGGRLLEIGAAYGFFLDLARPHFDVVGFEISPAASAHARQRLGLDVRSEDFTRTGLDGVGPVDATVMWDVIEHLERPDRVIARVAALSKPGALLFITTGDIGSAVARWRGQRWRLIHPPTHLHYFSRPTITRLLERHGFQVRDIRAVPVVRSLRQMAYSILALRLGQRRAYAALERLIPATAGLTLNTYDIMQVTAVRTASSERTVATDYTDH
ncbi:MAG: class I SAM-dependent methyltransferase [Deltaproteobacteria bacterium]|nr:class I SAM-dependent methyltransferase [Deltaproteobacteria bacterium]